MSSHVHLIIGTTGEKMEDIMRDLKRHTSKALLKAIADNHRRAERMDVVDVWTSRRAELKQR